MDKSDYIEMMQMSQKAEEFVEQLFLDNGYTVQREMNNRSEKRRLGFIKN